MVDDYYDLLDVPRDAPEAAIQAAFRRKVKEYHPDVSDAEDATRKFQAVHTAREVLTDPKERQRYERLGHERYVATVGDGPANGGNSSTRGSEDGSASSAGSTGTSSSGGAGTSRSGSADSSSAGNARASSSSGAGTSSAGGASGETTNGGSNRETTDSSTDGTRDRSERSRSRTGSGDAATSGRTRDDETSDGRERTTASAGSSGATSTTDAAGHGAAGTGTPSGSSAGRQTGGATGGPTGRRSSRGWRPTPDASSYPDGPFADPVTNLVARVWALRVGAVAAVLAGVAAVFWLFDGGPGAGAVPVDVGAIRSGTSATVDLVAALAAVFAVFGGHHLWLRDRVPNRYRDAVMPAGRDLALTFGTSALGVAIGAYALAAGGTPGAFTRAVVGPFAFAYLPLAVLLWYALGSSVRAGVLALPAAILGTVLVGAASASYAVPAGALPGGAVASALLALLSGFVMIWALGAGTARGLAHASLAAWNLRYRGGYRVVPFAWDFLLVVPVVSLCWLYATGTGGVGLPGWVASALATVQPYTGVHGGSFTRTSAWHLLFATPLFAGTALSLRRGLETLQHRVE